MAASEEDPLIQIAVQESVEPSQWTATPRVTIDDMIGRLALGAMTELPGFDEAEGDTWVFIDAAPKQPEQDQLDYEHYAKRCSTPIRLNKTTLMRLNSPVINDAFGPTSQYRVVRRRKLFGKIPEGIKNVIDLTPPTEGDDAVWLISSLSCSEGVRLWYHSQQILTVPPELVAGQEEYTSWIPNLNGGRIASHAVSRNGTRHPTIATEYSPIRHRAAIERLLAVAAGADPKLDSAPKLWTTFAVAKHFGIVRSPLTDYIVTWLRAYSNCTFLEVLTEVSHIMADHLEVYDLERDTFAMLVGEEALDSLVRSRNPQNSRKLSTFGRKKEGLPEHIQTRVEYASKAFLDRIVADFEELKRGSWIEDLDEVKRLSSFTHPHIQDHVAVLKTRLEEWVQDAIFHVQCANYEVVPNAVIPPDGGEDLIPRWDRKATFQSLRFSERVLTRTFWNALKSLNVYDGACMLDIVPGSDRITALADPSAEPNLEKERYLRDKRYSLLKVIGAGQAALDRLELPSLQRVEGSDTENLSLYDGSSSFAPLEGSKRFPLAIRPVLPIPNRNLLDIDGLFGDTSLRSLASIRGSTRPAVNWAAEEEVTRTSKNYIYPEVKFLETSGTRNDQSSLLNNNPFPPLDIVEDEGDALADWSESLHEAQGENASKSPDTTCLLRQAEELSHDQGILLQRPQINQKQSTKQTAETHQPGSNTTSKDFNEEPYSSSPKEAKVPNRHQFFNHSRFFDQATQHICQVSRLKLSYTDVLNGRNDPHKLVLMNTLVCLADSEFKYLPLWAGGCDDESGGVFNDEVVMPDVSFATAGPSIHLSPAMHTVSECDTVSENGLPRGIATPASSVPSSEYHLVNGAASEVTPSSNHTTAGYFTDQLGSDYVYAGHSIDGPSVSGDEFSVIARSDGMNPDDEGESVRRGTETMDIVEAAGIEVAMFSAQAQAEPVNHVEDYADIFHSDEDGGSEDDDGNASDDTMQGLVDDDDDDGDDNNDHDDEYEIVE